MSRTYFFWDPLSDNILQERDETGTVTAEYTTEPGLYGNLISQNREGVESQYHFDPQGSTLALSDDNQQATDTYAYSAFGEVTEQTGITPNPFQYIGQRQYYRNIETNEYSVRRRQLSANRGRWLSVDPFKQSTDVNRYLFVNNSPFTLHDPSGLFAMRNADDGEEPVGSGPCAGRESWDVSMCDECPPCKCGSTKDGMAKISPSFPIAKFWGKYAKEKLGIACEVHIKVGNCGLAGISWTCATGENKNKRKIYICISQDLDYCSAKALLYHEFVHAKQFCEQPNGPWGIPDDKCAEYEKPAYEAQCNEMSQHTCCVAEKSKDECKKLTDDCVKNGVDTISCNPVIRSTFRPCATELPKIFPES